VANIMLGTVTERTHDIGIRRAIGTQRAAIIKQVLTESIMIADVGDVLGMMVGDAITLRACCPDTSRNWVRPSCPLRPSRRHSVSVW
jgi:hypothetical protein